MVFQDLERRLEVDVRGNSAWFDQAAWAEAVHLREQVHITMYAPCYFLGFYYMWRLEVYRVVNLCVGTGLVGNLFFVVLFWNGGLFGGKGLGRSFKR